MKIGYPCSNLTLAVSTSRTFRLSSYSADRLIETVSANLDALQAVLEWNTAHDSRFFRISSATIPFASHPVMSVDWQSCFGSRLRDIGDYLRQHDVRINVHPGQYVILNSPREEVVCRAIAELQYHADLLDLLGLDATHKIQIHTGGVYGDKESAINRFATTYDMLPESIRRRLVIENDERQFSLADNLKIHSSTGIPVLFDIFHHELFNAGESLGEALDRVIPTWNGHGPAMIDYSSQNPDKQSGAHTISIDLDAFEPVLCELEHRPVDLMLEIKDKEASVLKVMGLLEHRRSHQANDDIASATSCSARE